LPDGADSLLARLKLTPSFLMVGTIEPRKGHLQAIKAFERLWQRGVDANLVIVGKEGWTALPDSERRTIPEIVGRLRHHPEKDHRLFWLQGVSDEFLERIYAQAACLLFASEGEGFGLPLIEAAQHQMPLIARDLPVFREVAAEHAMYFSGLAPEELADTISSWLELRAQNRVVSSAGMPWRTWADNARDLAAVLCR
jgi:glycosyltransferase involved in cell wall biosynthesis